MLNKLGKYEIRRELGRGAMGIVYEGFDPFIERAVAIKTIQKSLIDKSDAPDILGRFRREAQAAGRLTHPNIVSVYEYGDDGDVAFIAMEYIVGTELKERFDGTAKFELSDSTRIMAQLLDALEYSHSHGVVHRDIKPSNILITKDGQVKIADFGIAKIESSELTQVGTVMGTPSYMSPEQFMGQLVDSRSDIYSAGVILYQLLTGERPFTGSNMTVIMNKVMNQAPPSLDMFNPNLPKALHKVVKRAMEKNPEDRFQSAKEFNIALKLSTESIISTFHATSDDATMIAPRTGQQPLDDDLGQDLIMDFSTVDLEARLKELQQEASRIPPIDEADEQSDNLLREINMEFNRFESSQVPRIQANDALPSHSITTSRQLSVVSSALQEGAGKSSLLAGLAQEAKEKLGSKQSTLQEGQAKARNVDEALNRIVTFFSPFIQHVNEVQPTISRNYRFDARTIYSGLKWQNATLEQRKQSNSNAALTESVTLSVSLSAPEPVPIRRPWGSLETFEKELHYLGLQMIDNVETAKAKTKQEWLEARLAANFPVQIKFQGNYDENIINVSCHNLGAFGVTAFNLDLGNVADELLDGLGLFLPGRTDKLPAQLRRV